MLKQETIKIIKSTIPVLEIHGTAITMHFYKRLFAEHPELLNIFNHANQEKGRQPKALANVLFQAAIHIEHLEKLAPAVATIAHKHRSLGVKKEHYPIVGEHLLAAIKEVLGDAATDDIIQAWAEAYDVIASIFISTEEDLYNASGWAGFKSFKVVNKVPESDLITSFYVEPIDGMTLPTYQPGQYVSIRINIAGEKYDLNRQYSLSGKPSEETYRISVKREEHGKVSNWLHDHVQIGDSLEMSAPAGEFVLQSQAETPVVLISGGVGTTPLLGMLHALEGTKREVSFLHICKNKNVHAFGDEVKTAIAEIENGRYLVKYSDDEGRLASEDLKPYISEEAEYYLCGPINFMENIKEQLFMLGVENSHIHLELFGPAVPLKEKINM
ncbi:NO-inducible flavohemoprotein [Cytobacillus sp. FSL K6-0265]|uniref:NO-inducible flavohemoprotein n=1 Tax=Cytobacillus sp. FSL K6-0265 TaxID=2921448 RepID=UPI0030FBD9CC